MTFRPDKSAEAPSIGVPASLSGSRWDDDDLRRRRRIVTRLGRLRRIARRAAAQNQRQRGTQGKRFEAVHADHLAAVRGAGTSLTKAGTALIDCAEEMPVHLPVFGSLRPSA